MQFAPGIHRLFLGTLACLLTIGLSASYWAITGQDSLLLRDDNPRLIEALADIRRGNIYDRNDQLLAETTESDRALERGYLRPSTYSIVGYYSLRYGVGGAEAAFDELLSGSSEVKALGDFVNKRMLKLPQIGADIRLTLDAYVQDALVSAMGDTFGAVVVLDAQSGEIMALVSQPSFDPNTLDEDWDELVETAGQPFFNRALQGHYQLGSAMYTVLLGQAISSGFDITMSFPKAETPIDFENGMTIACLIEPEQADLTIVDAYVYGCPAAFQAYWLAEPRRNLEAILAPYAFDAPITLDGFPQPEQIDLPLAPAADQLDNETLELRALLGQGDTIATPLHMAVIMAAIATDGGVAIPTILSGARPPDVEHWQSTSAESTAPSIMSADVAQELRNVLRSAWSILQDETTSKAADVGAHIAKSQSGDEGQIWLNGFIAEPTGRTFAFVVLLENSDGIPRLISIGQTLIEAMARRG
jgi:peptidoglycan glycosyltransferase